MTADSEQIANDLVNRFGSALEFTARNFTDRAADRKTVVRMIAAALAAERKRADEAIRKTQDLIDAAEARGRQEERLLSGLEEAAQLCEERAEGLSDFTSGVLLGVASVIRALHRPASGGGK